MCLFFKVKSLRSAENFDFVAFSKAWDSACRRHYAAMLKRTRNYFQAALTRLTLPSGKKLAAIVTESFGPCIWPDASGGQLGLV